jgi:TonB family protein
MTIIPLKWFLYSSFLIILVTTFAYPQKADLSDKEVEGLYGPVHKVHTISTKVSLRAGKIILNQPMVLEDSTYDLKGKRVDTNYYPNPNAVLISGKEVYQYDSKGNIIEMALINKDGVIINKEKYDYEYDSYGNWTKMTASVATIKEGKLDFEISEIIERNISYYEKPTPTVNKEQQTSLVKVDDRSDAKINKALPTIAPDKDAPDIQVLESPVLASLSNSTKDTSSLILEPPPSVKVTPPSYRLIYKEGVLRSKAVDLPIPVYPMAARSLQAPGEVSVEVIIDTVGRVISARVIKGHKLFHQTALEAALKSRFTPTTISNVPVKVTGVINYDFSR